MQKQELVIGKASGKILLAGGYGVLQQNNYGLTLSLKNSFYCICTEYNPQAPTSLHISSPQIHQCWDYKPTQSSLAECQAKKNEFVQNALQKVLKYFNRLHNAGRIKLEILFHRNFISNSYVIGEIGHGLFPEYRDGYAKTGLGSSACVVVSVVECLVMLMDPAIREKDQGQFYRLVNVISQVANLSAQKKIGSNFDISTAVFGTHLYKNILPHKIAALSSISREEMEKLASLDPEIQTIKTPSSQLYSYIVDINKGADTRAMVKSFMTELRKCSEEIQSQFFSRSKAITLELFQAYNNQQFGLFKQVNRKHRLLQQEYSQITGVPIEPKDLTCLIDKICAIDGVLYAICPGSGGYDAIFVLASKDIQEQLSKACGENIVRPVSISYAQNQQILEQERKQIMSALQL